MLTRGPEKMCSDDPRCRLSRYKCVFLPSPHALAVALALRSPLLLAACCSSVSLLSLPEGPHPGCLPAVIAAIPLQAPPGAIVPLVTPSTDTAVSAVGELGGAAAASALEFLGFEERF
jgi:hypothetical protein